MTLRTKIALTFRSGGENGGPYNSHKRILESSLSEKYEFVQLFVPRARVLVTPWGMKAFVKEIKLMKPQLVQVTGLQLEGFLTMVACKLAGVKTLLAIHGSSTEALDIGRFRKWRAAILEKWTVRNADAVYGVCDYISRWDVCRRAKYYYGTIYNLSADNAQQEVTDNLRESLGISQDDIVVVSTGRITKDKGYDVFWDVIQAIGHTADVKYVIAGDGGYKEEWQRKISEKGFDNEVFLIGYRKDINNVLSCGDIFMMCTKHENNSLSMLEAAAHYLPLVATNVGGVPEIIDTDCGFLVSNGDVDGFCDALRILISDKKLRTQFGENAHRKISKKFDTEKILNKLNELYDSIVY